MNPIIVNNNTDYDRLGNYLDTNNLHHILIICSKSYMGLPVKDYVKDSISSCIDYEVSFFSDFTPNPSYESVNKGVCICDDKKIDCIIAIGGGSAIDVAKAIKNERREIALAAIPTTAGTGSEATHFAVIYVNGEKTSIADIRLIPELVFLDARNLISLPYYQRVSTMMDAMCHAIESMWAKGHTDESLTYSKEALEKILSNMTLYLEGDYDAAREMLVASNIAGKAINISKTTAAHAMSYKLSSVLNITHGHAAALCLQYVWDNLLNNRNAEVNMAFSQIMSAMGKNSIEECYKEYITILSRTGLMDYNQDISAVDIDILVSSVNAERLGNHVVNLTQDTIKGMYQKIIHPLS